MASKSQSASKTQAWIYAGVVTACFAASMAAAWWMPLARNIDNAAYDRWTRWSPPPEGAPQSVVVAIDEATLEARGGVPEIRPILSEALDKIAAAKPNVVAIDVILHDASRDAARDARLEASMRATPNLVLGCDLVDGKWEEPLDRFKVLSAAVGHVQQEYLEPGEDRSDGVNREIPIEEIADGKRKWAMALEAFRLARGQSIVESPDDLEIGDVRIPAGRRGGERPLLVLYRQPQVIPRVSVLDVGEHPEMIRGKVVFLGETALTAARDRLVNPYGNNVTGVEVHAHVFETLAQGKFLSRAGDSTVLAACAGLALAAGLIIWFLPGRFLPGWSGLAILPLLGFVLYIPLLAFRHGVVFPLFAPATVAFLTSAGAATYQYLFVRRQLRHSESEKSRYQQAIHWAAHEMRTPLTAIQGSSEIMSRYNLPDAKRHQLSDMINSESKRLSKIIQTFLDVERLAEGQMELKREPVDAAELVSSCMARVAPLAERKQIALTLDNPVDGVLLGDRELMEYALYNLLTNAVKYSPGGTEVHVFSGLTPSGPSHSGHDGELRLGVRDQGIGMDSKEVKQIFKKFYRTKRAEASGEVGTGIGLSIVEQIVTHHGGRIDVTSAPGKGSCFTMVLKANRAASAQDRPAASLP
ncbi:MAG TPA: CHASE2 domain-containing protein [Bryobacteraceae bacterium]|nr:CHASE2 domain-containing protein [Bryobacteraceae bacterium]